MVVSLLTAAVLMPVAGAEARGLRMGEARAAARAAVVAHPSYRSIVSSSDLVIDSCTRSGRRVRCLLHRWAPDPCALDGGTGPCVQVLTRRIWTVRVTRRHGRSRARVVRIVDSSASPAQSESARSSS
jgi:hypothetical protein